MRAWKGMENHCRLLHVTEAQSPGVESLGKFGFSPDTPTQPDSVIIPFSLDTFLSWSLKHFFFLHTKL